MARPRKPTAAVLAARARALEQYDLNAVSLAQAFRGLSFGALRVVNVTRRDRWHPKGSVPWTASDWSNALCGEAGELANVIKKIRRHETGTVNKGDPSKTALSAMAADELADVVIYADLLAEYLGINLGEAVRFKFNRVSQKYGFPERLEVREDRMGFESVRTSGVPRLAAASAAVAMDRIRDATRALLMEHARGHVERTGGLDCPTCLDASLSLRHVDDVLAGDSFL